MNAKKMMMIYALGAALALSPKTSFPQDTKSSPNDSVQKAYQIVTEKPVPLNVVKEGNVDYIVSSFPGTNKEKNLLTMVCSEESTIILHDRLADGEIDHAKVILNDKGKYSGKEGVEYSNEVGWFEKKGKLQQIYNDVIAKFIEQRTRTSYRSETDKAIDAIKK
jgi:hypothetical protein